MWPHAGGDVDDAFPLPTPAHSTRKCLNFHACLHTPYLLHLGWSNSLRISSALLAGACRPPPTELACISSDGGAISGAAGGAPEETVVE